MQRRLHFASTVVLSLATVLAHTSVLAVPRHHRERVRIECPLRFDDAGLVLARVGTTVITACDLAIARVQRARAGMSPDDLRATLRDLVDDALLAEAARETSTRSVDAERWLAEALVRAEARTEVEPRRPTASEVDRWIASHPDILLREARVHLRQLVLPSQAEAHEVIRALRAGTAFETLLPRSVDPLAARDQGDLGLLGASGASGVPAAVVAAGFALQTAGDVAATPIAGMIMVQPPTPPGRRRRRPRPRRVPVWHVVQLIARTPQETVDLAEARRRAADRMLRDRYDTARAEVRARLIDAIAVSVRDAPRTEALQQVHVAPVLVAPAPPRSPRRR